LWAKSIEFLLKSVGETLIESSTTREDDVTKEISTNMNVTILNRFVVHLMHTGGFITFLDKTRVEETHRSEETRSISSNTF
jgi:hypothetical protein